MGIKTKRALCWVLEMCVTCWYDWEKDINISELGDYWRWRNGPYAISKQYDIKLHNPEQLNKFISSLDKQGVASLSFGEMKNNDMEQYDRRGRIQALENARDKAAYMVQTFNGTLAEPLQIVDGNMPVTTTTVVQTESPDTLGSMISSTTRSISPLPNICKPSAPS